MINTPMYRKIYDDLIQGISEGIYPPGGRLPSEKELAEMYSVSRITSKKALEMLAERGVIYRKPGKGSYVLDASKESEPEPAHQELTGSGSTAAASGSLQTAPSSLIGVVLDMIDPSYGCELLQGIEYECRRNGADLMIRFTYGSSSDEAGALAVMRERGAKGILLMCSQNETYSESVLKMCVEKYPLVLFDRDLQGLPVPSVTTDNYQASCDLTEHLIAKGHTKICFISHSSIQTSSVKERFYGYRDTMTKYRLTTDERLWMLDLDEYLPRDEDQPLEDQERVLKITSYILQNTDVTAFFAVNFQIANLVSQILKTLGIQNKEVVCFDAVTVDELLPAQMTHVEQDQFQMGVTAVRMLFRRIRGEEFSGRTLVPYRIIEANTKRTDQ